MVVVARGGTEHAVPAIYCNSIKDLKSLNFNVPPNIFYFKLNFNVRANIYLYIEININEAPQAKTFMILR